MKIIHDFTTILEAEEGYVITNGTVSGEVIYLGKEDSVENWTEVLKEEVIEDG